MNQKHFDKHIREQLERLSPDMDTGSWDLFVEKLEINEASTPAQEATFDNILRDKLNNLTTLANDNPWDLFEQKLNQEEAGTPVFAKEHFDEVIFTKIHSYSVPYDAATWTTLLRRLRIEEARRWEVVGYKFLELAIIALLILLGSQITLPTSTSNHPLLKATNSSIIISDTVKQEQTSIKTTPNTNQETNTLAKHSDKTSKGISSNVAAVNILSSANNTGTLISTEESSIIPNKSVRNYAVLSPLPIISLATELSPLTEQVSTNMDKQKTQATEEISANFDFLVTRNTLLNIDEELLLLEKKNLLTNDKNSFRVGMFGSAVFDHIYTPYDRVLLQEAYDRYSNGYGGGFSISKQVRKWEIESGLMYIAKNYKQKAIVHIYNGSVKEGYEASYITDIELNILNIPLHIRYNILGQRKWRMYALSGASLQLILQSNYDANVESLGAAPPDVRNNGTKESSGKSFYNRKKFPNGFLVDKNFKDNRFYTFNLGLGLERFITPRWSIFAQPTYQQTIQIFDKNGIGPNQDRINSMLILMGAKVGL